METENTLQQVFGEFVYLQGVEFEQDLQNISLHDGIEQVLRSQ